ncbi:MAG: flagellin, partial [Candidatus Lambdaproteobacteria bacterium]|nr:flagellin [Candidatus Lambdaproteobacteria bacterium]
MALRINHNIAALNALRNLNKTDKSLSTNFERLSSGLKVNRAADGPATLVISEQMRGQIASIDQAIRNSESSISMLQTSEAALTEVNALLTSLRQLAIHAANEGANDEKMLDADQAEVENALDTIDRIARTSQFGTRTLLDGSNGANGVAVGNGLEFVRAEPITKASPAEGYAIDITRAATRSQIKGQRAIELEDLRSSDPEEPVKTFTITVSEGGKTIAFSTANNADRKAIEALLDNMQRSPEQ